MCGLIALSCKINSEINEAMTAKTMELGRSMLQTLRMRGPDECNLVQMGSVFLGHTRLSIIDLQTGSQPIFNETKTVAVLLNGEIYNFHELRYELERLGHIFQTNSDTEVIAHLYEECGEEVFSKLNGMFAIVIYDYRLNILLAARDRTGEKPLLYCDSSEYFTIASEIKAFLKMPNFARNIDVNAVALYLNSMYIPAPISIFSNIKKLPPAHYLRLEKDKLTIYKYWNPQRKIDWRLQEIEVREKFLELFSNAVKIRTYSDVPFGVFLSGGIDSSAVTAFMATHSSKPIKTFSVGFNQEIDERPYARLVAKRYQTDHTEIMIDNHVEDMVDKVFEYFDEPFGDSSAIPTYLISREARRYVKVILTGDGGDELFAGYNSYIDQKYQIGNRIGTKLYRLINQFALKYNGEGLLEKCYPHKINISEAFKHWHKIRTIFSQKELEFFLEKKFCNVEQFFKSQNWLEVHGTDALSISYCYDLNYYLPDDLLKKVDMASMFASLECRAPFLDHRLLELSLQIPPNLKIKHDKLKYLLKYAISDYLPSEILNRSKCGFGAPIESWLKFQLKEMTQDLLAPGCRIESLIYPKEIQKCLNMFYHKNKEPGYRVSQRLWSLLVLEIWMRKYAHTNN